MDNTNPRRDVTEIVAALGADSGEARPEDLMPLVYDELRRLAKLYLRGERPGHTLEPTALVHEAYLKLVDYSRIDWKGRTHFLAVGARVMRRLLIDHARERRAAKRGGGWQAVTLSEGLTLGGARALQPEQLLTLDNALERLAELDPREERVVTLRFFGGLTMQEVAAALGVSKRTAENDWRHARAWLERELSGPEAP